MLRLTHFRVTNFRNVIDSGWIELRQMTAFIGQNESGKSNLCEALFRLWPFDGSSYDLDFDWPVDRWEHKSKDAVVCSGYFEIPETEEDEFLSTISTSKKDEDEGEKLSVAKTDAGEQIYVTINRKYDNSYTYSFSNLQGNYDKKRHALHRRDERPSPPGRAAQGVGPSLDSRENTG